MNEVVPGREAVGLLLNAIPGMAGAALLDRLSDGPANQSFRVESEGRSYVLRLDKPEAARLGLNRNNEFRIAKVVFDAGLAPEPVYYDPEQGVYLRHFLQGSSWSASDLQSPPNLIRLAHLLSALHGLPPIGDRFDPLGAARRYSRQINSDESRAVLEKAETLTGMIDEDSSSLSLCHNDLVCQNILECEPLTLIDWEYAGVGHPFFDLAVVVQHHGLGRALTETFLCSYLGRPVTDEDLQRLNLHCDFYACLLQLWNLRVAEVSPGS